MVIQKVDIFNKLGIEDTEEADKVFNLIIGFFAYMKKGDEIRTGLIDFQKVEQDLIWVQTKIDEEEILDSLEKMNIVKIPG